jgi:hypothetical protein
MYSKPLSSMADEFLESRAFGESMADEHNGYDSELNI